MAQVTITVNGVTVQCAVEDIASVTAALGGTVMGGGQDDGVASRPGERRRENPESATQRARAEEFRRIRSNYTSKTVEEVAAARLPKDRRKRSPHAGDQ